MREWSVYLQSAHGLGADHDRLRDYSEDLAGALERHHGVASYDPLVLEARFNVEARTPVEALASAHNVLAAALAKIKFPDPIDVVSSEVQTIEELDRELRRRNLPPMVGISEIAKLFDVSKQRAVEVSHRPDFPKPLAKLAAGPIWNRHAVLRFLEQWPRKRTGRPRTDVYYMQWLLRTAGRFEGGGFMVRPGVRSNVPGDKGAYILVPFLSDRVFPLLHEHELSVQAVDIDRDPIAVRRVVKKFVQEFVKKHLRKLVPVRRNRNAQESSRPSVV